MVYQADAVFRLEQQGHAIMRPVQEDFCKDRIATIIMPEVSTTSNTGLKSTSQDRRGYYFRLLPRILVPKNLLYGLQLRSGSIIRAQHPLKTVSSFSSSSRCCCTTTHPSFTIHRLRNSTQTIRISTTILKPKSRLGR